MIENGNSTTEKQEINCMLAQLRWK